MGKLNGLCSKCIVYNQGNELSHQKIFFFIFIFMVTPVTLLLDNINMYRGHKRHQRLFKVLGPKMWNFTERGAIIPISEGIQYLLRDPTMFEQPQKDLALLKAERLLLVCHSTKCWIVYIKACNLPP